jgi:SAM-dependent methyltransferase
MADANFVRRYFVGKGIDIGGKLDPLSHHSEFYPQISTLQAWDLNDGDAQFMKGVADETFDFVYSSHCLEHLHDPREGLINWFRILKPNGHLIVTVPDEDLYEQGVFPSSFNDDHKWTFTLFKTKSWSERSLNLLSLFTDLGEACDLQKIERLDSSYRYDLPRFDQTLTNFSECGIEFVIRKRPRSEITAGGRLPNQKPTPQQLKYALSILEAHMKKEE